MVDTGPLELARQGVVAVADGDRPLVAVAPLWHDGAGVWTLLTAGQEAELLRAGNPAAVWADAEPGSPGAFVVGSARVFGFHDPVGLLTHVATVSTALATLATINRRAIAELLDEAATFPPRLPANRVVVRVALRRVRGVVVPDAGPGIAPPLPAAIPIDVRRAVSGERHVVIASASAGEPHLTPGVWDGDFRLAAGELPPAGSAVTVVAVRRPPAGMFTTLVLGGLMNPDGTFTPTEATWWNGFKREEAVEVPPTGALQLPD